MKKGEYAGVSISDLAAAVKAELQTMDQHRQQLHEAPLFALKDFTLELSLGVKSVDKKSGELKAEVLTLGSDTEFSKEQIQKLQVHWEAIKPTTYEVSPQSPANKKPTTDRLP